MALKYNGNEVKNVTYNGTALKKLQYNGTTVWEAGYKVTFSYNGDYIKTDSNNDHVYSLGSGYANVWTSSSNTGFPAHQSGYLYPAGSTVYLFIEVNKDSNEQYCRIPPGYSYDDIYSYTDHTNTYRKLLTLSISADINLGALTWCYETFAPIITITGSWSLNRRGSLTVSFSMPSTYANNEFVVVSGQSTGEGYFYGGTTNRSTVKPGILQKTGASSYSITLVNSSISSVTVTSITMQFAMKTKDWSPIQSFSLEMYESSYGVEVGFYKGDTNLSSINYIYGWYVSSDDGYEDDFEEMNYTENLPWRSGEGFGFPLSKADVEDFTVGGFLTDGFTPDYCEIGCLFLPTSNLYKLVTIYQIL